jgi:S1-C subfamily serine protease
MKNKIIKNLLAIPIAIYLFPGILIAQETNPSNFNQIFNSVVMIKNESFLSEQSTKPWMKESFTTGLGTGLIISPNQILTNAHVVIDSKFLTVRLFNKIKPYVAKIKYLGVDCDLAIIEVDDPEFSKDAVIFPFSKSIPTLGSDLLILGYPNGTDNLTVEKGSILNLEKMRYSFSGLDFRSVIKIKASVYPGNSGGPAIQGNKVVGIVFQLSQTERETAYLIPTSIIEHFLADIADGKYDGFPNFGFNFQSGNSNSLKSYYKIPIENKGILLNAIYPQSSFYDYLKEKDFLYRIDEFAISNEGDLITEPSINLIDYLENKFIGDSVTMYFYRNGEKFKTTAKLKKTNSLDLYRDESTKYYINSGLVFQPVSRVFFANQDLTTLDSSSKYHFSYYIQDKLYKYNNRDIVLSYLFDDPENLRYKKYSMKIVETINGIAPSDLKDFIDLWKKYQSQPILIKFRGIDLPIVLTPEFSDRINIRVKKRYGVDNETN